MGPGDLLDTIDLGPAPPYDSTHQRIGHRHLQRSEGAREGGREGEDVAGSETCFSSESGCTTVTPSVPRKQPHRHVISKITT